MPGTIQRELRVAFSKKGQSISFRVAKWTVFVALATVYFDSPFFWHGVFGVLLAGILVHLFYRRQTRGWTRPWGGWNDLDAGR